MDSKEFDTSNAIHPLESCFLFLIDWISFVRATETDGFDARSSCCVFEETYS